MNQIDTGGQQQKPRDGELPTATNVDKPEFTEGDPSKYSHKPNNKLHNAITLMAQYWELFKEKTDPHEKLNTFFTCVIAVATVVYVIVASCQLRQTRIAFETEARAQITITNIRWRVNRDVQPPQAIQKECADEGTDSHVCFEIDLVDGGLGLRGRPKPQFTYSVLTLRMSGRL